MGENNRISICTKLCYSLYKIENIICIFYFVFSCNYYFTIVKQWIIWKQCTTSTILWSKTKWLFFLTSFPLYLISCDRYYSCFITSLIHSKDQYRSIILFQLVRTSIAILQNVHIMTDVIVSSSSLLLLQLHSTCLLLSFSYFLHSVLFN